MPFDELREPGVCPFIGKPSRQRVAWAKSYSAKFQSLLAEWPSLILRNCD
ncbi:MAG: hypothetical protein WCG66_10395 [bacterium]